jgi:hypothetical protein
MGDLMTKEKEVKPTAAEKRAAKRRETAAKMDEVFGTGKGSLEPTLNPLDYNISMMCALNYYNSASDYKEKRKWFMSYVGKKSTEFDALDDSDFRTVGTLIRMKQREQPLSDKHLKFIEDTVITLREKAQALKTKDKEEKPQKVKASIQDRIVEAANTHIAEINGMIDEFVMNDTDIDVRGYLLSNEVSPQVSKLIPAAFEKTISEVEEAVKGKDEQLVEGYSNFKKSKLKKFLIQLKAIESACQQQVVSAKAARKPRARKEKPASVLAAKVKYMKDFAELKLTSEKPEKIIGASEVWIYNTKYKKLQAYRSTATLSIKGTTILNYDVATSGAKTIRKPELITGYVNMNKRALAVEFKNLKTKEAAVNGRINEDCIILKIFS